MALAFLVDVFSLAALAWDSTDAYRLYQAILRDDFDSEKSGAALEECCKTNTIIEPRLLLPDSLGRLATKSAWSTLTAKVRVIVAILSWNLNSKMSVVLIMTYCVVLHYCRLLIGCCACWRKVALYNICC